MCISGGCNAQDNIKAVEGKYQLVFFSPEVIRLCNRKWRKVLGGEVYYSERLKGSIIDEAHCVKRW